MDLPHDAAIVPGGDDKMPAEMDRTLLRAVIAALDCTCNEPAAIEKAARVLHRARRTREKEMRGNLVKLGGQGQSRKYQLIRLTAAHTRLKARHKRKHNDCEILKRVLFDANYSREQIIAMLTPMPTQAPA